MSPDVTITKPKTPKSKSSKIYVEAAIGSGTVPHIEFANQLRALMLEKRKSASDLARGVWGTMTDPRGYEVARNRDRIGHYLSGKSYPEPANRVKIAKVLGVDADVLEKFQPAPVLREAAKPGPNDLFISFSEGDAGVISITKMTLSNKTIAVILDLIAKDPVRKKAMAKKATE